VSIDINLGGTTIGRWSFNAPQVLVADRTSGGAVIRVPCSLTLRGTSGPWPLVTNLRARVLAFDSSGLDLGVAEDPHFYAGARSDSVLPLDLRWRVSAATLEHYERQRNGGAVRLTFECRAEVCKLINSGNGPNLRGEPSLVSGTVPVNYPTAAWVQMLNTTGLAFNVFVELPLRPAPPAPWDGVWQALADARASFDQGGTTGWRNCVTSVRLALERWRQHEAEPHGPGWHAPSVPDREARTAEERLGNLRWDLLQCAHRAPHSAGVDWSREEAVFVLASLVGLLAIRNP